MLGCASDGLVVGVGARLGAARLGEAESAKLTRPPTVARLVQPVMASTATTAANLRFMWTSSATGERKVSVGTGARPRQGLNQPVCPYGLMWIWPGRDISAGPADRAVVRSRVHEDRPGRPRRGKEEGHLHGGAGWHDVRGRGPDEPPQEAMLVFLGHEQRRGFGALVADRDLPGPRVRRDRDRPRAGPGSDSGSGSGPGSGPGSGWLPRRVAATRRQGRTAPLSLSRRPDTPPEPAVEHTAPPATRTVPSSSSVAGAPGCDASMDSVVVQDSRARVVQLGEGFKHRRLRAPCHRTTAWPIRS